MEALEKVCVVHNSSISDPGRLQPLTEEKLEQFKTVKKKRLLQPLGDVSRMASVCLQIPETLSTHHGYHTNCAKRFTVNLKRLRVQSETSDNEDSAAQSGRSPRKRASILFPPECIYCGKEGYVCVNRKKQYLSDFIYGGGSTLAKLANECGDFKLHRKIAGVDLFAVEAKYHRQCDQDFRAKHQKRWRSKNEGKLIQ